jgi:hypothetical protein
MRWQLQMWTAMALLGVSVAALAANPDGKSSASRTTTSRSTGSVGSHTATSLRTEDLSVNHGGRGYASLTAVRSGPGMAAQRHLGVVVGAPARSAAVAVGRGKAQLYVDRSRAPQCNVSDARCQNTSQIYCPEFSGEPDGVFVGRSPCAGAVKATAND